MARVVRHYWKALSIFCVFKIPEIPDCQPKDIGAAARLQVELPEAVGAGGSG